jgi:TonB-linked SusC/RagA family outer membrane protein
MGLTKIIASILLLMAFVVAAQAQVTVTLVDGEGKPVAEATVEANKKVIGKTDADGTATLDASYLNQQLCFTHVGFQLFCEKVTNNVNKFTLKSNDNFLDAAVVTSYENTTRRNTVGNVSSIDMSKVPVLNTSNTLSALQGLAPGLDIQVSGGGLGQASKVRVQGDQSLLFSAPPIYVIDGVVVSEYQSSLMRNSISPAGVVPGVADQVARGNYIDFLDFNNIESITILKDADAVAIYGSRGANGAIIIKSKKANSERISLNSNSNLTWQPRRLDLMNTEEYLYMRKTAIKNSGISNLNGPSYFDLTLFDSTEYNNWQKILMGHTVFNYNLGFNISTVSNNSSNSFSLSYRPNKHFYDEDGRYEQFILNNTWNAEFLDKKLKITNVSNAGYLQSSQRAIDLTSFAVLTPPNFPKEMFDKNNVKWFYKNNLLYSTHSQNPLYNLLTKFEYSDLKVMNSTSLKYSITNNSIFDIVYGVSTARSNDMNVEKLNSEGRAAFPNYLGVYKSKESYIWNHNIDGFITNNFFNIFGKFNLTNILGFNYNTSNSSTRLMQLNGKVPEEFSGNYQYYSNIVSRFFDSNIYKYAALYNRLMISSKSVSFNINYRYDGSSRFAPENRWASFYSLALGWNISDSDWWKFDNVYLKIRSSYGRLGNDNIPDYGYLQKYRLQTSDNYPNNSLVTVTNIYSRNYKWEDIRKLNIGYDFIWKDFSFIFDYTRSVSKDQLIQYRIPDYLGQSQVLMNFPGVFRNESFEFSLGYNLKLGKSILGAKVIFTLPKDKLVEFPNLEFSSYSSLYEVGRSKTLSRIPKFGGVDPESGIYYYLDKDGKPTSNFGNSSSELIETPIKYYGSLNLSLNIKKIRIFTNIYFREIFSTSRSTYMYSINASTPGQRVNNYKFLLDNFDSNSRSIYQRFLATPTPFYPYDSKYLKSFFIRMNNLNFAYKIDRISNRNISSLDLNLYLNNILFYTNSNMLNYEFGSNTTLPQLSSVGLMLTFNFK